MNSNLYYKALLNKDSSYEGVFFAGIKTTGIFCKPTCTAKKPKPENVVYFSSTEDALRHGFRPCKLCHPLSMRETTPPEIAELMSRLQQDPEFSVKDEDLRAMGIDPVYLRRWFKKNHGITFHVYKRMRKISHALTQMQEGDKVSSAAFDTGYDSLSGFTSAFKNIAGVPPSDAEGKTMITIKQLPTPLGMMFAGATEKGLCLLEFLDRRMLQTQIKILGKRFNAVYVYGDNKYIKQTEKELEEYFEGKRNKFEVPLDIRGTEFQEKVWAQLVEIGYGTTRSYKSQAIHLGRPAAVRAVANANGQNRIAIIIPCHRVIGESGDLTGYGGGLARKKWLLDLESRFSQINKS